MDDLVEIAADDAARNIAEDRQRDRIHFANAKVRVHDIHAERRLVEERLELFAAIAERPFRLAPHPRQREL